MARAMPPLVNPVYPVPLPVYQAVHDHFSQDSTFGLLITPHIAADLADANKRQDGVTDTLKRRLTQFPIQGALYQQRGDRNKFWVAYEVQPGTFAKVEWSAKDVAYSRTHHCQAFGCRGGHPVSHTFNHGVREDDIPGFTFQETTAPAKAVAQSVRAGDYRGLLAQEAPQVMSLAQCQLVSASSTTPFVPQNAHDADDWPVVQQRIQYYIDKVFEVVSRPAMTPIIAKDLPAKISNEKAAWYWDKTQAEAGYNIFQLVQNKHAAGQTNYMAICVNLLVQTVIDYHRNGQMKIPITLPANSLKHMKCSERLNAIMRALASMELCREALFNQELDELIASPTVVVRRKADNWKNNTGKAITSGATAFNEALRTAANPAARPAARRTNAPTTTNAGIGSGPAQALQQPVAVPQINIQAPGPVQGMAAPYAQPPPQAPMQSMAAPHIQVYQPVPGMIQLPATYPAAAFQFSDDLQDKGENPPIDPQLFTQAQPLSGSSGEDMARISTHDSGLGVHPASSESSMPPPASKRKRDRDEDNNEDDYMPPSERKRKRERNAEDDQGDDAYSASQAPKRGRLEGMMPEPSFLSQKTALYDDTPASINERKRRADTFEHDEDIDQANRPSKMANLGVSPYRSGYAMWAAPQPAPYSYGDPSSLNQAWNHAQPPSTGPNELSSSPAYPGIQYQAPGYSQSPFAGLDGSSSYPTYFSTQYQAPDYSQSPFAGLDGSSSYPAYPSTQYQAPRGTYSQQTGMSAVQPQYGTFQADDAALQSSGASDDLPSSVYSSNEHYGIPGEGSDAPYSNLPEDIGNGDFFDQLINDNPVNTAGASGVHDSSQPASEQPPEVPEPQPDVNQADEAADGASTADPQQVSAAQSASEDGAQGNHDDVGARLWAALGPHANENP